MFGSLFGREKEITSAPQAASKKLSVDVYQTKQLVVIYAQAPGADMTGVDVSIEGNADVILVTGMLERPEYIAFPDDLPGGEYVIQDCAWGAFRRKIKLPVGVDIEQADAKIKNGVLVVKLPLLETKLRPRAGTSNPPPQ